ncbi:MAG: DUF6498-containing protein [Pseudomonadota bacterium]
MLKPVYGLIVAFNLVPLAGVWLFGWKTFDLIFLYWMENVIIGAFTVLRMLVRPYLHPIDLAAPAFMAPFFTVHYGMFCFVHGLFVVSLFGSDDGTSRDLLESVALALDQPGMLAAFLSLVALQVSDWLRDTVKNGLGTDGMKHLMIAPYRRIVVLHVTIIGGGFLLTSLGDPVAGLMLLVVLKTLSDIYHARRDDAKAQEELIVLTDEQLAEMAAEFGEPVVTVNGKQKRYDSFAELKRSREFRLMKSVMRLMGAGDQLRVIDRYFDLKIAEEQASAGQADKASVTAR